MSNFNMVVFVSSYYNLFCHVWLLSLETCSFLMRGRRGVDLEGRGGGEGLEGAEGGKTIIGIYCIRRESKFNKRKNGKKK